jgi:hypothetical protein
MAARTPRMEKMPMVTPSKERKVRNKLVRNAFMAKKKLSFKTLR